MSEPTHTWGAVGIGQSGRWGTQPRKVSVLHIDGGNLVSFGYEVYTYSDEQVVDSLSRSEASSH
jgi:hypothetical protein